MCKFGALGTLSQNVFRRINQQFDNKTGISEPPILLAVFWTKLVVQCERGIHSDLTDKRLKDKEGNVAKGGVEWFKDTPTQILPTVLKWVKNCNLQQPLTTSLSTVVKRDLTEGDKIMVVSGPFKDFAGEIVEVSPERSKLKTSISIFGIDTPVEIEINQVERQG